MNQHRSRIATLVATLMVSLVLAACGEVEKTDGGSDELSQDDRTRDEAPSREEAEARRTTPPTTEIGTSDPSLGSSGIGAANEEQRIKRPPE